MNKIERRNFHYTWLQRALENQIKSNTIKVIDGDMKIEEYIELWCKEDLVKTVEVK